MKYNRLFFILISIISFNSCDILRLSHFEIISWTPETGYHNNPDEIFISLNFSHEPDKMSVERNFSLTGDDDPVKGNISWDGNKLIFTPLIPLEKNKDYVINLSSDAHDTKGVSMEDAFTGEFTTRFDNSRPVLISCYPAQYDDISDKRMNVKLKFSAPVSLNTLYENVSYNPSMTGLWKYDIDEKSVIFIPLEEWSQNNRYEIKISSSLINNNGMNIRKDFSSIFTTGIDKIKPILLNVMRITGEDDYIPLLKDNGYSGAWEHLAVNEGWEKDDKLMLVFSKPVDTGTVKNNFNADDSSNLIMLTPYGFSREIIFKFETNPAYNSRFSLRIKPGIKDESGNESADEYVYRISANGRNSKPPTLIGIRIPMSPKNNSDPQLKYFSVDSIFEFISITDQNYPSGESIKTWIELYFDTAEGAEINLFSVMELFRIETSNNVLTFSARSVNDSGFIIEEPHPGTEDYKRIEIRGNLVNSTFFGIINFQIAAGLLDNLGNKNEKQQKISVIK